MLNVADLWNVIQHGGAAGILFLAALWGYVGNVRGWWISGREADALRARSDKFEAMYDRSAELLQQAVAKSQDQQQTLRDQVEILQRLVDRQNERAASGQMTRLTKRVSKIEGPPEREDR